MFNKITRFFSCDGINGLINNPEDFLLTSKYQYIIRVGDYLKHKKKSQRKEILDRSVKPKITIILPVYNSEETISKAIRSIQDQSYSHWELLIIDDGSSDGTLNIIKSFSEQNQKIKVFQNTKNKGVAYSRNIGLYFAKGDFITFHDADDYSHYERLEYQLALIISKPIYMVVVMQYVRVNTDGEKYLINGRYKWNRVSGMLFPKKVVEELGYFKPINISEDSEYYERVLAFYGKRSRKILCKVLYYAFFSPNSLLFSNATVSVEKNSINYQINDIDYQELEKLRQDHMLIKAGKLSPYESFNVDEEITRLNN